MAQAGEGAGLGLPCTAPGLLAWTPGVLHTFSKQGWGGRAPRAALGPHHRTWDGGGEAPGGLCGRESPTIQRTHMHTHAHMGRGTRSLGDSGGVQAASGSQAVATPEGRSGACSLHQLETLSTLF